MPCLASVSTHGTLKYKIFKLYIFTYFLYYLQYCTLSPLKLVTFKVHKSVA